MIAFDRQEDTDPAAALIEYVLPALFEAIHYGAQAVNKAEGNSGQFAQDDAKQRLIHRLALYLFRFDEYDNENGLYPLLTPHQLADPNYAYEFFEIEPPAADQDAEPPASRRFSTEEFPQSGKVDSVSPPPLYTQPRTERLLAGRYLYAAVGQKLIAAVLPALTTSIERAAAELARDTYGDKADIISQDVAAGALINGLADVLIYAQNENEDELTPLMTLPQMRDPRYATAWFKLPESEGV